MDQIVRLPVQAEMPWYIRRINYLIFIVYSLLIFEGGLRKWIFPEYSTFLFFIKDPFILYIYFICFRYRLFPTSRTFAFASILALLFFFICFLQSFLGNSIVVGIYGWRNYFLYMPVAFIIAEHFKMEDLIRIAKFTCYISIPITVLLYFQYSSPPDSFINKNVGMSESIGFQVIAGVVRPSGTFSFTLGQSFFTASIFVMLLFNVFLEDKKKFLPAWVQYLCFACFLTSVAISGSRTTLANVSIILFSVLFSSIFIFTKTKGLKSLLIIFSILMISFLIFSVFFTKEIEIFNERQDQVESSIFIRLQSMLFDLPLEEANNIPFFGNGIGFGTSGGSFLATGIQQFTLGETEWARIVLEMGFLWGFIYILFRIYLGFKITINAYRSLKKSSNPIPFIFLGFILFTILFGTMTMNGISNAYGWLFLGISMAVNKLYNESSIQDSSNSN